MDEEQGANHRRGGDVSLFDVNCMLGPTNTNREPAFRSAGDLLAEMDRVGIAESLVYASQARMAHPADGNGMILEMTKGHSRLYPCWVVMPAATSGMGTPEAQVKQMTEKGVRAARIFPEEHNFPILEPVLRSMLLALSDARIPLIIDVGRTGWGQIALDWRSIFEIAERHPNLPLILLREGGTTERILYEVWDDHPNIHLETSYMQASQILEENVDCFGGKRLLFGTAMPQYDSGGALGLLNGAQLSLESYGDIGGNNLRRLFGLPKAEVRSRVKWPCGQDGFRVFDIHGHIGLWPHKYYCDGSVEEMVERMDQTGVERFAVSDILAIGPDYKAGNDRIGDAVARYPERIVGYVVYNPNYESEMADEMKRGFDDLGCRGIKIHCAVHETSTEDPRYRLGFQTAHVRQCPILCHVHQGPSPDFLMRVLGDFPDAKFIYAHVGGGSKTGLEPFLEVANLRPNLFFDLGVSQIPRGTLAWLVEQVPHEQILYGSDHPLNEFTFQLGRVIYADIPDNVKRAILWDNSARIFDI